MIVFCKTPIVGSAAVKLRQFFGPWLTVKKYNLTCDDILGVGDNNVPRGYGHSVAVDIDSIASLLQVLFVEVFTVTTAVIRAGAWNKMPDGLEVDPAFLNTVGGRKVIPKAVRILKSVSHAIFVDVADLIIWDLVMC